MQCFTSRSFCCFIHVGQQIQSINGNYYHWMEYNSPDATICLLPVELIQLFSMAMAHVPCDIQWFWLVNGAYLLVSLCSSIVDVCFASIPFVFLGNALELSIVYFSLPELLLVVFPLALPEVPLPFSSALFVVLIWFVLDKSSEAMLVGGFSPFGLNWVMIAGSCGDILLLCVSFGLLMVLGVRLADGHMSKEG